MKYLDGDLRGKAGIIEHIQDMKNYLDPANNNLVLLKDEMKQVFNQKQALGLLDNQKQIEKFNDRKPEYIFVLTNHDPDSKILYDELQKVKKNIANDLPFDLKFATSNFMGYGLYKQNIYGLDDFIKLFSRKRRYVMYKGYADASRVPADWHGWLHHTFDEPPTKEPFKIKEWEKPHVPNMTGTLFAYHPKGSIAKITSETPEAENPGYEAWKP